MSREFTSSQRLKKKGVRGGKKQDKKVSRTKKGKAKRKGPGRDSKTSFKKGEEKLGLVGGGN